jgi:hypothetical protein
MVRLKQRRWRKITPQLILQNATTGWFAGTSGLIRKTTDGGAN